MIVISVAELRNNMKKYLDLASTEKIVIQRGKVETFILSAHRHIPNSELDRAITKEELLDGIRSDIRTIYAGNKQ